MESIIVQTKGLEKCYGKTKVLQQVDFTLKKGEIVGLIGQNGSGKTTLLRLICGLMKPTKGSIIRLYQEDKVGYMPQTCRLDDSQTVGQVLKFFTGIKQARLEESLNLAKKLELDVNKKVKFLSPGQQKKIQMIIAMIGNPEIFILDEPTAGLDPEATEEIKVMIAKLHEEQKTVLICSHLVQDMQEMCTRVCTIRQGVLCYE